MTQEATKEELITAKDTGYIKVELPEPFKIGGTTYETIKFIDPENPPPNDVLSIDAVIALYEKHSLVLGASIPAGKVMKAQMAFLLMTCRNGLSPEDFDKLGFKNLKAINKKMPNVINFVEHFFSSD